MGAIRLINGSQQMSRNLMTESVAIFEAIKDEKKVAEAQTEMALCCMREDYPFLSSPLPGLCRLHVCLEQLSPVHRESHMQPAQLRRVFSSGSVFLWSNLLFEKCSLDGGPMRK